MERVIAALLLAVATLTPGKVLALEGGVVDNALTGCLKGDQLVGKLQRGAAPSEACGPLEEQIRFAETPLSHADRQSGQLEVRVVSWDVKLGFDEQFSPAPGMEMVCSHLGDFAVAFRVTANGMEVAYLETETLGRRRQFVYQQTEVDQEYEGQPFLIRAGGIASTVSPEEPLPCASEGFAEFFDSQ